MLLPPGELLGGGIEIPDLYFVAVLLGIEIFGVDGKGALIGPENRVLALVHPAGKKAPQGKKQKPEPGGAERGFGVMDGIEIHFREFLYDFTGKRNLLTQFVITMIKVCLSFPY
jgi:hypothetical protein